MTLSEVLLKCPHCGTQIQDGLGVCPACNNTLDSAVAGDSLWCKSCGSPIPQGAKECPVCGLPIQGAFEEDWDSSDDDSGDGKDSEVPQLSSAIPPTPQPGEEDEREDAFSHTRLLVMAVVAALVVVGGTALFITRPWDPNAYSTHATEDADTSMEGFPGTVSHLSAQDELEAAARSAYLRDGEKAIDEFVPLMVEIGDSCTALEGSTETYVTTGKKPEGTNYFNEIVDLKKRLHEGFDPIAELDMSGSDYETKHERLVVTCSYLVGRVETLYMIWEGSSRNTQEGDALVAARSAAEKGYEGRSLEEWRSLYNNSLAGFQAEFA